MKATELRIGNLIFQSGQITIIENISRSINDWERVNNKRLFDCTPIPLTEEWLLKFGFEKEETGYWTIGKLRGGFTVCRAERKSDRLCYRWFVNNLKMTDLHFVHQLQNLYFALTGEELTLKP